MGDFERHWQETAAWRATYEMAWMLLFVRTPVVSRLALVL